MPPLVSMKSSGPALVLQFIIVTYACHSDEAWLKGRQGGIYKILPDALNIMKHKRDALRLRGGAASTEARASVHLY